MGEGRLVLSRLTLLHICAIHVDGLDSYIDSLMTSWIG